MKEEILGIMEEIVVKYQKNIRNYFEIIQKGFYLFDNYTLFVSSLLPRIFSNAQAFKSLVGCKNYTAALTFIRMDIDIYLMLWLLNNINEKE